MSENNVRGTTYITNVQPTNVNTLSNVIPSSGTFQIDGNINATGTLSIQGDTTLENVNVTNNVTVGGGADIVGSVDAARYVSDATAGDAISTNGNKFKVDAGSGSITSEGVLVIGANSGNGIKVNANKFVVNAANGDISAAGSFVSATITSLGSVSASSLVSTGTSGNGLATKDGKCTIANSTGQIVTEGGIISSGEITVGGGNNFRIKDANNNTNFLVSGSTGTTTISGHLTVSGNFQTSGSFQTNTIAVGIGGYGNEVLIGGNITNSGDGSILIGEGATGGLNDYTTAIGYGAAATRNNTNSIGYNATASAEYALALGDTATASANFSTAIGNDASATHDESTAIGNGATSTAANQVILGTASETVEIPGDLKVNGKATLLGAPEVADLNGTISLNLQAHVAITAYMDTNIGGLTSSFSVFSRQAVLSLHPESHNASAIEYRYNDSVSRYCIIDITFYDGIKNYKADGLITNLYHYSSVGNKYTRYDFFSYDIGVYGALTAGGGTRAITSQFIKILKLSPTDRLSFRFMASRYNSGTTSVAISGQGRVEILPLFGM